MLDRVKPSFVILTSGHSDAQSWASEWPDVKTYKWRLNPVWHRMLYRGNSGRQRVNSCSACEVTLLSIVLLASRSLRAGALPASETSVYEMW